MLDSLIDADASAIPLTVLPATDAGDWIATRPDAEQAWLAAAGFTGKAGASALLPDGDAARAVFAIAEDLTLWDWAALPASLPAGTYALADDGGTGGATDLALAWALNAYAFDRYKQKKDGDDPRKGPRLVWPDAADRDFVIAMATSTGLIRDLINTPAVDMGPDGLAATAADLARTHGADIDVTVGDDLLAENYPAIHAVGRAHDRAPRLIDIRWGPLDAPKVTLVGKGVCFDTGGLDIKSAAGMRLMKKDMGGAAHVLGIANMVMTMALPVRLRVLVPAVENSIAGNAMRPGDVVPTRKGLTIEIGNTDAEGRVILSDALAEATDEAPEMIIDFATLTGAARVALGTELPALFSNDDALADDLLAAGTACNDPFWRMPLWAGYDKLVDGKVADVNNAPEGGFGGAITAALFLQRFVNETIPWAHIDLMAWNPSGKPGRPEGGEAMGLRAVYAMLKARYGG